MKCIVWKDGKYKYRPASLAFINNVRVAVVSWLPGKENAYNANCLLPGYPKACNVYQDSAKAREAMEEIIQDWFKKVEQ